eukprot:1263719-Pyramimonas_sp.AAC.1
MATSAHSVQASTTNMPSLGTPRRHSDPGLPRPSVFRIVGDMPRGGDHRGVVATGSVRSTREMGCQRPCSTGKSCQAQGLGTAAD